MSNCWKKWQSYQRVSTLPDIHKNSTTSELPNERYDGKVTRDISKAHIKTVKCSTIAKQMSTTLYYRCNVAENDLLACWMTPSSISAWHSLGLYPPRLVRTSTVFSPTSGWMLLLKAGVSDSRGAAFGTCLSPATAWKDARWTLCGCCAASSVDSTGVTQASTSANTSHHSACVMLAKISLNLSRSAVQSWNCGASSGRRPRPNTDQVQKTCLN